MAAERGEGAEEEGEEEARSPTVHTMKSKKYNHL